MTRVRFGDVVNDIKVNVDRQNNPYDIYVAGDHMDSEDLTLHRWGSFATDDVGPAFIRIFKPGQVLYGSRRTYLKKIVVAPFEGITANTTFVLETKNEDEFSQRLLPFIMLSDDFTEWSIRKSKGSTNPYVLFSDLADYEFDLPSPEEQRRLADKLWAAYELKEAYKKMIAATDEMAKAQFIEMFGTVDFNEKGWELSSFGEQFAISSGGTPDTKNEEYWHNGSISWIGSNMCQNCILENNDGKYITQEGYKHCSAKLYKPETILIALVGATIGKVAYLKFETATNQNVAGIEVIDRNSFEPMFIYYLLQNMYNRFFMLGMGKFKMASLSFIKSLTLICPPIKLQQQFIAIAEQADKSKSELRQAIEKIDRVMKSLMQ